MRRYDNYCRSLVMMSFFLLIISGKSQGQDPPSPQTRLASLQILYQQHVLRDTAYLKAVDSVAPQLVRDPGLVNELATYHQIAFDNAALGRYRRKYFTYLTMNAYNMNKFGSAIYYAEKNYDEGIKAGLIEKGGIINTDMFAVAVYYNNRDYPKVFAKYDTLRPVLMKLPAAIPSGKISSEQEFNAFGILNAVVYSAYKTKDTVLANEGILLCEKMLENTRKQPEKYKGNARVFDYVYYTLLYQRENNRGHLAEAGHFLQLAFQEIGSGDFPSRLKPSYTEDLCGEAFDFYFDHGRKDSAQHYLDRIRVLHDSMVQYSDLEPGFLQVSSSKLLAANGQFEPAYKDLLKVYRIRDSVYYAARSDRDNNLYALAEAENVRNDLIVSEEKKQKAQLYSFVLVLGLAILAVGGGIWFFVYRSRQKQRLLNLQLNLARNFHDDIGPMLLYANILAKKEAKVNPTPGMEELKAQIGYIMEAVRGISHDLKSSKLSTVSSFYKEVTTLLEKIKSSARIDFTSRLTNGGHVLSQLQYSNLWKIVNELISNSVKHAGCNLITLDVQTNEGELRIEYADDGKGLSDGNVSNGIGLQNMKERAKLLNGELQWRNAYPHGYSVLVLIPIS